jgi:paraquat-inducible protein B
MSVRANPTLIGTFLVGAVAIVIVSLMLWGGDFAWRARPQVIMYFDNSVKGLEVGAPVDFRGVSIGKVIDIGLIANVEENTFLIPVVAEITRERYTGLGDDYAEIQRRLNPLIDRGLRASLELKSWLTGQLYVNLDIQPYKPARFRGDGSLPEIPTVITPIQEFGRSLEDFDMRQVLTDVSATIAAAQRILNNPEVPKLMQHLTKSAEELESVMTKLNRDLDPLSKDTMALIQDTRKTMIKAQRTLDNAQRTLDNAQQLINDDSSVVYNMNTALEEIANAARSIRALADALERNPEAMFRGKKSAGGN